MLPSHLLVWRISQGIWLAVLFLCLRLNRQTAWEWEVLDGRGKQHLIPKVYPGFTPVPGEAERLQTPPPIRWINPADAALSERGTMLILGCAHGDEIGEETAGGRCCICWKTSSSPARPLRRKISGTSCARR